MRKENIKFTIQNVPIKCQNKLHTLVKKIYLQYKMFLLNKIIWNI